MIACVRTTAVVVPSPALSLVLVATSFTMLAPMFSNLSASVISLAIETPSLVIVGPPHDLSSATLRPLGPSVTRTAPATMSTPRLSAARTSVSNITCLAIVFRIYFYTRYKIHDTKYFLECSEDVALGDDVVIFLVDGHFVVAVRGEHYFVTRPVARGGDDARVGGP